MSAMRLDDVNERLTQAQIMIEQINNITVEQGTRLEVKAWPSSSNSLSGAQYRPHQRPGFWLRLLGFS